MIRRLLDLPSSVLLLATIGMAAPAAGQDLAITNVTLHPAPDAAPIDGATIIIRDGRVAGVGVGLDPGDLPVLDGEGRAATAGLWNCHVHLTDQELADDPGAVLGAMLLAYGFTNVVDTGSELGDTLRLAADIATGRVTGPKIVTAGGSLVYTDGTPAYLPDIRLPEVATPAEAGPLVNGFLDGGADGIKIFSGSFKSPTKTVLLPPVVIRAITAAAHARDGFVIAHPTDRDGLANAVRNGVDVLAHTAPPAGPLGPELTETMLQAGVALIPTLKLWSWELARNGVPVPQITAYQNAGVDQVREYFAAGGEILFGTDVGYMRDYDSAEEFEMMRRAGLEFRDVLAALTTLPARRFSADSGTLEPGALGDVVIFHRDPAEDVTAFAEVAYTVRGGRVVHGGSVR
jgi:imidazolonepropionase-like amidohydrolase